MLNINAKHKNKRTGGGDVCELSRPNINNNTAR